MFRNDFCLEGNSSQTRFQFMLNYSHIARFIVVGGIGFLVDAGIITILLAVADWLGPVWARSISFPVALISTWLLNRAWCFGDRRRPGLHKEMAGYAGIQLAGFALNHIIFIALVTGVVGLVMSPLAALATAGLITAIQTFLLLNYSLYHNRTAPNDRQQSQ